MVKTPSITARLPLGAQVRYTATLQRKWYTVNDATAETARHRVERHPISGRCWEPMLELGTGVLAGYRRKAHGWTDRSDSEDGPVWVPTGYVMCALVYRDLHRAPVYVPLDYLFPCQE